MIRLIYKISFVVFALVAAFLVIALSNDQELFIESLESKTSSDSSVFNKIKWFRFKDIDVWMMNQSHHGAGADAKHWERLAIVIDKTQSPMRARFYQLEAGPLVWSEHFKEKPFRVSCFMCHNNGPRAIRPNNDSSVMELSLRDQIKIFYWNLRMKSYGRIMASAVHDEQDKILKTPFRYQSPYENEALKVSTCMQCHKEEGFMARGLLRRQQWPTIAFMLESGQMPPSGFKLSGHEKKELDKFLQGF